MSSSNIFGDAFLKALLATLPSPRSRSSWNERFSHWETSESNSETQRIERARRMVQEALASNSWLQGEGVRIIPQGSFTNRTNTRLESDIDLRVQHPLLKIEYGEGVSPLVAWNAGGYNNTGIHPEQLFREMRRHINAELVQKFGAASVDASGKKAIRVAGLEGSRAEVDVVPCVTLHRIEGGSFLGRETYEGVALLAPDGRWTFNYPDQHIANGRAKRLRTGLQFKRVVRSIKRLQSDMEENGSLKKRVPSFLIECLVYMVEDGHFTVAGDDRYGRVKRVLARLSTLLQGGLMTWYLREINEIKPLFNGGQSWRLEDAQEFVSSALGYLGDL